MTLHLIEMITQQQSISYILCGSVVEHKLMQLLQFNYHAH